MPKRRNVVDRVGSRASIRVMYSETHFFGEIVAWNGLEVSLMMEDLSHMYFGANMLVELRIYTVNHAEVLEALTVQEIKGMLYLLVQPGCRVDRDIRLARWRGNFPVRLLLLRNEEGAPCEGAVLARDGVTFDLSHTGLAVRADGVPPIGTVLHVVIYLHRARSQRRGSGSEYWSARLQQLWP